MMDKIIELVMNLGIWGTKNSYSIEWSSEFVIFSVTFTK
jgi:hypothetical protein